MSITVKHKLGVWTAVKNQGRDVNFGQKAEEHNEDRARCETFDN